MASAAAAASAPAAAAPRPRRRPAARQPKEIARRDGARQRPKVGGRGEAGAARRLAKQREATLQVGLGEGDRVADGARHLLRHGPHRLQPLELGRRHAAARARLLPLFPVKHQHPVAGAAQAEPLADLRRRHARSHERGVELGRVEVTAAVRVGRAEPPR